MACAVALPSAGCLPIVYATPPVRISGTLGVQRMDTSPTIAPTTRAVDGWQRDLGVRATLNPLQVPKRMHDRLVDFGLGYGWQWGAAPGPLHGPLVEVGIQRPLGSATRARWGVRASFMALDASSGVERIDGFQGGLQAMVEWSTFADDPYSHDCDGGNNNFCGFGHAYGEGGAGLFLEAQHARLPGVISWAMVFGVSIQLPATVGAGILLLDLDTLLR